MGAFGDDLLTFESGANPAGNAKTDIPTDAAPGPYLISGFGCWNKCDRHQHLPRIQWSQHTSVATRPKQKKSVKVALGITLQRMYLYIVHVYVQRAMSLSFGTMNLALD